MSKFIGSDSQQQQGGDNSTNIQTGGDTQIIINGPINTGLGVRDVKEIAKDVMRNEFAALSMQAKNDAILKVEEFIDRLLSSMGQDGFDKFSKPSIQIALRKAQCGYIESDEEKDIEDVLIEVMRERIQNDDIDSYKKILTGALEVVPSLTSSQNIREIIEVNILPFYLEEFLEEDFYDFIQYSKVLKRFDNPIKVCSLKKIFAANYQYIFSDGFSEEKAKEKFGDAYNDIAELLVPCGERKVKFKLPSASNVLVYAREKNMSDKCLDECQNLILESANMERIEKVLLSINDKFSMFIKLWEKLPCQYYKLSKLGIVIAYINCSMHGVKFGNFTIQKALRITK